MANLFILDNMSSFTYNLVDQLRIYNHKILIFRNNLSTLTILKLILNIKNPILILSPGPGIPSNAGCMFDVLKQLYGKLPIMGICLGHQAIIELNGGQIIQTNNFLHGRSYLITHDNKEMFTDITNPLSVACYHSLIGINIPTDKLTINASYHEDVMAIRDTPNRVCGFQFHPESILTRDGYKLLINTIFWLLN